MNWMKIAIPATAAAILGFAAAWWLFGSDTGDSGAPGTDTEREILYWVAPMDSDYRRDEPGKSPMGMDLVPVYADEQDGSSDDEPAIRIRPAVVNNIGVKTAPVERGTLYRNIGTVGFVVPDDERVAHIHVRTEGWIEVLESDTVGDRVSRGDLLFRIYSPALVSAQEEYLQALRADRPAIIRASESRLRALGMGPGQIESLRSGREILQLFDVHAPQDGYVMELNVRQGMFVKPGSTIMSLADLSTIWVDVDVFENQIDWVKPGQAARMTLPFAPDRVWTGKVEYVYPTVRANSRTAHLRLAFDNPDLMLKPGMYASVEIDAAPHRDVLHVPAQAVIRSGREQRVILALGDGRFRPTEVRAGLESEGRVEIIEGLAEGETIVISSHFLIDSEASMDASLLRMLDPDDVDGHDMSGMDSESGRDEPEVPDAEPDNHGDLDGHEAGDGS